MTVLSSVSKSSSRLAPPMDEDAMGVWARNRSIAVFVLLFAAFLVQPTWLQYTLGTLGGVLGVYMMGFIARDSYRYMRFWSK